MPQHGVQQVLGVGDVIPVVACRFPHGFAYLAEGGEVQDCGYVVFREYLVQ